MWWLNQGIHHPRLDSHVFSDVALLLTDGPQCLFVQIIHIKHCVLHLFCRTQQLINFDVQDAVILVLDILDHERQKRDYRHRGTDDHLRGIVVVKMGACGRPDHDELDGSSKGFRAA